MFGEWTVIGRDINSVSNDVLQRSVNGTALNALNITSEQIRVVAQIIFKVVFSDEFSQEATEVLPVLYVEKTAVSRTTTTSECLKHNQKHIQLPQSQGTQAVRAYGLFLRNYLPSQLFI